MCLLLHIHHTSIELFTKKLFHEFFQIADLRLDSSLLILTAFWPRCLSLCQSLYIPALRRIAVTTNLNGLKQHQTAPMYPLWVSVGQESSHGLAGSSAQGFTRLHSRRQPGLGSHEARGPTPSSWGRIHVHASSSRQESLSLQDPRLNAPQDSLPCD